MDLFPFEQVMSKLDQGWAEESRPDVLTYFLIFPKQPLDFSFPLYLFQFAARILGSVLHDLQLAFFNFFLFLSFDSILLHLIFLPLIILHYSVKHIFDHSFMAIDLHVSILMTVKNFNKRTPNLVLSGGSADPALLPRVFSPFSVAES